MLLLVGGRVDLENYLISRERPHTVFDVKIMFQMVSCKPVSFSKVDYFGKKNMPPRNVHNDGMRNLFVY